MKSVNKGRTINYFSINIVIFASSCYIFLLHGVNGKVALLLLSVTYLLEKSAFITIEGFMDKQFLANPKSHSVFNLLKKTFPACEYGNTLVTKDDVERKTALLVEMPVCVHNATHIYIYIYTAEEEHIFLSVFSNIVQP